MHPQYRLTFTLILNMRETVRIIKQGYCIDVCVYALMCVCLLLYKGTHVKLLIFYHKPVVVMKQLLFNLTRYACYLRRADMKKI